MKALIVTRLKTKQKVEEREGECLPSYGHRYPDGIPGPAVPTFSLDLLDAKARTSVSVSLGAEEIVQASVMIHDALRHSINLSEGQPVVAGKDHKRFFFDVAWDAAPTPGGIYDLVAAIAERHDVTLLAFIPFGPGGGNPMFTAESKDVDTAVGFLAELQARDADEVRAEFQRRVVR